MKGAQLLDRMQAVWTESFHQVLGDRQLAVSLAEVARYRLMFEGAGQTVYLPKLDLTADRDLRIRERRQQGATVRELETEFGIGGRHIRRILKAA